MKTPAPLALVLALFLSTAALGHHGWAGYGQEQFELTGTVETSVNLSGPHATMQIRVDGQLWDVTLGPSGRTARAGLKEGVIPVGAQVTVTGHRNNDAKRFEVKTERVTHEGKVYNVYPDRE